MSLFKVAIPNKGALSEGAVKILTDAGYRCKRHSRELVVRDSEHAVEFIAENRAKPFLKKGVRSLCFHSRPASPTSRRPRPTRWA